MLEPTRAMRSFELAAHGQEFLDALGGVVHAAVIHRFHRQIRSRTTAAMAVILAPQGPLSLPCENTTVLTVRLKKRPLAAVTDTWHWMKNSRARRTKCHAQSTGCAIVPILPAWILKASSPWRPAAVHFSLPAGHLLFEAGSDPDGVYLLASGRLGVKTPLKPGLTAEIEHGELVGEAGWLSGYTAQRHGCCAAGQRTSADPQCSHWIASRRNPRIFRWRSRVSARGACGTATVRNTDRSGRTSLPWFPTAWNSTWPIWRRAWSMS